MIIRDGTISYYHEQPQSMNFLKAFTKGSTKPKGQVEAKICEFKAISPGIFIKKHKYLFEISFISPKKKYKRIFWVFSVSNADHLQKWLFLLEEAKEIGLANDKDKAEAQKRFEEEISQQERQKELKQEALKRAADIEKRRHRQKEKIIEEEKRKIEIENEIKRLQLEAEEKRKQEIAEKRREKYQKLLENSWDYNFQKIWSKSIEEKGSFEENLTYGFRLFKHVGIFISKAVVVVKSIVTELSMPMHKREIIPIEDNGQMVTYTVQNMLIYLTMKSDSNSIWKNLGHEFRGNSSMFEVLYYLSSTQSEDFVLRVPLCTLIDYKGFRALVIALSPLEGERTLIHGPKSDGVFISNPNIYPALSKIAESFHLKEHVFEWNHTIGPVYVHLSAFSECHKSFGYRDLEEYIHESMGKDATEDRNLENHIYLLKLSNVLPVDYSLDNESPDFSKRLRPEFFQNYQQKISADSFINIHHTAKISDNETIIASNHLKSHKTSELANLIDSLSLEIFDSRSLTETFHQFGINIRYLGLVAQYSKISFVKNMIFTEVLARSCKNLMFQHISEYLANYPNEEGAKNLDIEIEEINFTRKLSFFGNPVENENKRGSGNFTSKRNRSETKYGSKLLQIPTLTVGAKSFDGTVPLSDIYLENAVSECIVDFFNLVFGNDEESSMFWDNILVPYASNYYSVSSSELFKSNTNLNSLLHALCYHCSVYISFDSEISLGNSQYPFKKNQLQFISYKFKAYSMQIIEYKSLSERSKYYRNIGKHSLALQTSELRLRISKVMNPDSRELGSPTILTEISEILVETGDIENAITKAKEALVQIHPLSARSVNAWCVLIKALFIKGLETEAIQCFDNAIVAINFHWGDFHPLSIKIYSTLASIYIEKNRFADAISLYKKSILFCLKVLGPNHIFTAQVYMELSHYFMIINKMEDALEVTEKAYLVFEAFYNKESIVTATAGVKLAEILINVGNYAKAKKIIAKSCEVYKNSLENNKEIINNEYETKTVLEKFYLGALIGLTLGLKINEFNLVIYYTSILWKILSLNENPDNEIALQLLKYSLEAKFSLMSAKKKSMILNMIYVKCKYSEEKVNILQNNFNSKRFVRKVQNNGGINAYIESMLELVYLFGSRLEKLELDEENKLVAAASELRAILEIIINTVE